MKGSRRKTVLIYGARAPTLEQNIPMKMELEYQRFKGLGQNSNVVYKNSTRNVSKDKIRISMLKKIAPPFQKVEGYDKKSNLY